MDVLVGWWLQRECRTPKNTRKWKSLLYRSRFWLVLESQSKDTVWKRGFENCAENCNAGPVSYSKRIVLADDKKRVSMMCLSGVSKSGTYYLRHCGPIVFCDEIVFNISGHVNQYHSIFSRVENPRVIREHERDWCAITVPLFFEMETMMAHIYIHMLQSYVVGHLPLIFPSHG